MGGEFWTKGFYVSKVGRHGDENTIQEYVKNQGTEKDYKSIHHQQLVLFCYLVALLRGSSLICFTTKVNPVRFWNKKTIIVSV